MKHKTLKETIQDITEGKVTEASEAKLTQESYIEWLESALTSIAEEMGCDTEDLLEMALTAAGRVDPYKRQKKNRAKYLKRNTIVPASKHGPTDAKSVDPKRPGARHGPTI